LKGLISIKKKGAWFLFENQRLFSFPVFSPYGIISSKALTGIVKMAPVASSKVFVHPSSIPLSFVSREN
jgi:hypothetical protein